MELFIVSGIFGHVTCMWTQEWVEGGYVPINNALIHEVDINIMKIEELNSTFNFQF